MLNEYNGIKKGNSNCWHSCLVTHFLTKLCGNVFFSPKKKKSGKLSTFRFELLKLHFKKFRSRGINNPFLIVSYREKAKRTENLSFFFINKTIRAMTQLCLINIGINPLYSWNRQCCRLIIKYALPNKDESIKNDLYPTYLTGIKNVQRNRWICVTVSCERNWYHPSFVELFMETTSKA